MKNSKMSLRALVQRTDVRVALLVLLSAAVNSLSASPQALATALGTNGQGWLLWALRIMGGLMAIGGIVSSVDGFTGTEEGYRKVTKVGGGLLLLAIGGYCLGNAATLITTLHLDQMFSAV